jgi:Carboxypeptidase regulatory-like domain
MAVLRRTLAALTIVFAASAAYAQGEQGRITGRVADISGAALPGTTVTIVSARLAEPVVIVADDVGQFNSPPLPAGTYTVVFELAGFETKTRTGLDLRAGEVMTLDGHLPVASVKETVEVVAPAPPPEGPPLVFEAPKPPQTIPVPPEVLASVCGPGQADAITLTVGRILGHRDEKNRTLFGAGDILVLDSGAPNGLAPGQNYVVRRRFRVGNQNQAAKQAPAGQQTAGLIQVVETAPQHAVAVVVYACGELYAGDTVEPFDALPMWRAFDAGSPRFDEPAHVIFGEYGRQMGAPKQLMVIDRGSAQGAERGQRVTIFRRPRGQQGPVSTVGDAIVIAVRSDTATIRIERASDAVMVGDLVALHR